MHTKRLCIALEVRKSVNFQYLKQVFLPVNLLVYCMYMLITLTTCILLYYQFVSFSFSSSPHLLRCSGRGRGSSRSAVSYRDLDNPAEMDF